MFICLMNQKSKTTISESDSGLDKVIINGLTRRQIIEKAVNDMQPKMSFFERMQQLAELKKKAKPQG